METLNTYSVTVSVESQGGYSHEVTIAVDAYSIDEAKTSAEEKARDNTIFNCVNVDSSDDSGDALITYDVSVETMGMFHDANITIDAYNEDEARESAEEKVNNNMMYHTTEYVLKG